MLLSCLCLVFTVVAASGQDLVAKSGPRSPDAERLGFKLPAGFEAQLVAAEPAIQKPMQMAFDAKGRLWVTTSHHYPFAAKPGKGTDRLYILSEFDRAGRAGKVQLFDDRLNIPIGVLPLPDGNSVLVSECGSILKLTDTTGDGRADSREILYSGFGFDDTHGMCNSFTSAGYWIHACHGFRNTSVVKGKDGHEVRLQSGSTFRFSPDGSHIEVYTRGQVNPFGMCLDPWKNLYTADCHSRPMTQLIRGATYESFSKPHDGLGFAPHVINHMHDSTGLCGIVYYAADYYPKDWNGVMFVGNVVTSRINCDRIAWHGSTPVGKAMPDFLVSDDPWFRPVDLKIGPDGAIYVADFYNRIVGHYEVDLKHPGRDKDRGRIWRIVRTDKVPPKQARVDQCNGDVMLIRALNSTPDWTAQHREVVRRVYITSKQAQVQRAALEGIIGHAHAEFVTPLLDCIPEIPADDTHMMMAARIALRNSVVAAGGVGTIDGLTDNRIAMLFDIAPGIRTRGTCEFLAKHLGLKLLNSKSRRSAAELIGQVEPNLAKAALVASGSTIESVQALMRGMAAAGLNKLPAGFDREVLQILKSATLENPRDFASTLKLAASFAETRTTFDDATCMARAAQIASDRKQPAAVRADCAEVLLQSSSPESQKSARILMADSDEPLALRSRVVTALLAKPTPANRAAAKDLLKTAPYALAQVIATGLAMDAAGAETLLVAVKVGEAPARLLQETAIVMRLQAAKVPNLATRLAALTKNLPSIEKRIDTLITARAAGYRKATVSVARGQQIFVKNCASCHQVGSEGAKIGPQLDGIGIRGLERLLEDTLDPNRNVDQAFRATRLEMTDGRNVSGLLLRDEDSAYILADSLGKEVRVSKGDVELKTISTFSAMPGNLETTIPEADYYNLLAYLLDLKQKK